MAEAGLMLAGIVSADNSTKRGNGTGQEFGKGYYAFFGVIAGFMNTVCAAPI